VVWWCFLFPVFALPAALLLWSTSNRVLNCQSPPHTNRPTQVPILTHAHCQCLASLLLRCSHRRRRLHNRAPVTAVATSVSVSQHTCPCPSTSPAPAPLPDPCDCATTPHVTSSARRPLLSPPSPPSPELRLLSLDTTAITHKPTLRAPATCKALMCPSTRCDDCLRAHSLLLLIDHGLCHAAHGHATG
jgi:hypothetical protein